MGEVEGVPGGCVASPRGVQASRWSGKQEVAEACAGVRRPRALPTGARKTTGGEWRWAGPASAAGRTGRRQVGLSLSSNLISVFYFAVFVLIWFLNQIILQLSGNYCGCIKVYPRAPQNIPGLLEQ